MMLMYLQTQEQSLLLLYKAINVHKSCLKKKNWGYNIIWLEDYYCQMALIYVIWTYAYLY